MSLDEIKDVLKDNLEKRGVLNKIRANLRAEIFKTFEDQSIDESTEFWLKKQSSKPKPSDIQFLINELFIEYLEYNNMDYTKSVFLKECNQPEERLEKRFLSHELNIRKTYDEMDEDGDSLPLLYSIIHRLRNENLREKRRDLSNANDEYDPRRIGTRSQESNNNTSVCYQKPILHMEPLQHGAQLEIERIQTKGFGIPSTKQQQQQQQRMIPLSLHAQSSINNVNRPTKQQQQQRNQLVTNAKLFDLNSSAISSTVSTPRTREAAEDEVNSALTRIIQQNPTKLSRVAKKSSPPPQHSTGIERMMEPKSSRMFNLNRGNHHEQSSDDSSSEFSLGPNEKRITTGIPQFSVHPFRGDDSHLDDSIELELVYKR